MPHQAHLRSLRVGDAFIQSCVKERYTLSRLRQDLVAGLTVGIIAIPLSMALAIASGVAPQYGLYTAIIAGALIPLTGGSRYSISGPTAAFVVILLPVTQEFGLSGLLLATLMAGFFLVLMGLARLGRLIEYIPRPVTLGFTAGIAIVIAVLQLRDFMGLPVDQLPPHFWDKAVVLVEALPRFRPGDALTGGATLLVLILWPRLRLPLPAHLPALLLGVGLSLVLADQGMALATLGSHFSFTLPDGTAGSGIPPVFPELVLPWNQPGPDGEPLGLSWSLVRSLMPQAFSIAMLGAIESLLCAVVLDGMSGRRHSANSELVGQGIGNLAAPFFGGITATAAIARSAANYRAGGQTPVAGVVHAATVLLGILVLAPLLAYLPMASMAALLLMVAWNMSEAPKVVRLIRRAPRSDIYVLLTCLSLTVLFDMVLAIGVGIVLASLLFMRDIGRMTRVTDISRHPRQVPRPLPEGWAVFKIAGPLFFAPAERVFAELEVVCAGKKGLVLYMDAVPLLDAGGLEALEVFLAGCRQRGQQVLVADLQFQPLKTLARARIQPVPGALGFHRSLAEALEAIG